MGNFEEGAMYHLAVKAALKTMLQEVETEYTIYSNLSKVDKHSLPGDYKTFIGSNFDKTIYRQLLTAISGTSSNFESNPKKTCLLLSIGICLNLTPAQQEEFEHSMRTPPLTDENRALLTLVERSIAPYTDEELFLGRAVDKELLKVKALVERALSSIPLLKVIRFKVGTSYEQALQDTAIVQLKLDAEMNQDNERNKDVLLKLDDLRQRLRRASDGEEQVVFMQRLTYPNTIATCTCGNCGEANDARGILRARVTPGDYEIAYKTVFSRFTHASSAEMQYSSILHNAGIITPIVCSKCGVINIPSEEFMLAFKLCVLGKWMQSPPSPKNKDVMLTYSASAIVEGITAILQNNQELVQEILQSYRPTILAEKVELQIPKFQLGDLVSSESYTEYFSMLNTHNHSRYLQDSEQRQELFLQYMLSLLHINTVNASPQTFLESILSFQRFSQFRPRLEEAAKRYGDLSAESTRVFMLHNIISSEHYMAPLHGYIDMVLNSSLLTEMIKNIQNAEIRTKLLGLQNLAEASGLLEDYLAQVNQQLSQVKASLEEAVKELSAAILSYERELYNDASTGGWENFILKPLAGVPEGALQLSAQPDAGKDSEIYKCEACNMLWQALRPAYVPLMYQTVVKYAPILRNNSMVFGGLFAEKSLNWGKTANRLCRFMDVDASFTDVSDYNTLFGEFLFACLQAKSPSKLIGALKLSESRLLRSYTIPLPSNEYLKSLTIYSVLDEVDFPVGLSAFAQGSDVSDYQMAVQQRYVEDLETGISNTESSALAECAASFYCLFAPTDVNKSQLREQLGGNNDEGSTEI